MNIGVAVVDASPIIGNVIYYSTRDLPRNGRDRRRRRRQESTNPSIEPLPKSGLPSFLPSRAILVYRTP